MINQVSNNIPNKSTLVKHERIDKVYYKIEKYIDLAKTNIMRSVNSEMVSAYWLIGREIVEEEQLGQHNTKYGSYIIAELSKRLNKQYGKGFGLSHLKDIRQFYITYSHYEPIGHALRGQSKLQLNPQFSWLHYRIFMRIKRSEIRQFYEIEALKNNWSGRELERQVASLLFERLIKSKDKTGVLKLACSGQEINNPSDAIKDPFVLEFLGLPESHRLVESKVEEALITNLQKFLLELGKGFAFVARQKRLTLEGDHFYSDLVFYHTILKCYIIIDIKTRKLTHADLGQIQLYANYFDREVKIDNDNPTIGLVLCTEKNDTMVKYLLGDKAQHIFASTYQFHLPTEQELETELKREIDDINKQLAQEEQMYDS